MGHEIELPDVALSPSSATNAVRRIACRLTTRLRLLSRTSTFSAPRQFRNSLKTVAVELRMQFFKKPDLLLRKGKRNRFRMWRTIEALGTRALRLVTAPSLNELEKLFNRGIVEDVGETDANVKLFFDQPGQARRGKRMEASFQKAFVQAALDMFPSLCSKARAAGLRRSIRDKEIPARVPTPWDSASRCPRSNSSVRGQWPFLLFE